MQLVLMDAAPGALFVPAAVRARFWVTLGTGQREERFWQAFWVAYCSGYAVAEEIRQTVEDSEYLAHGNKLIKQAVMEDLPQAGLLVKDVVPFFGPVRLTLVRISEEGVRLGSEIGIGEPGASEWTQVVDGHRGDEWQRHMVGLLAFAWQARRRMYNPQLLPGRIGKVWPDVYLEKHQQSAYAEFETRARGKLWKWRRAKKSMQSFAVCTFKASQRRRIVAECREVGAHVQATDLETLLRSDERSPLFVECSL